MSAPLAFLDVAGVELANSYRVFSYMQRGLSALNWQVGDLGCSILGREVGGTAPFLSPALDPAPWYDASVAESAEFLGFFITSLDFQTITSQRSVSQRFGGVGGGVIGFEQLAARGVAIRGMLIASTCPGLEYGRHWLHSKLGADCAGCSLDTVRVRESCPPVNGSNDTRGERIIYDAALVDGIRRLGVEEACCDYDEIEFTLAGESPYLYSRAGTPTAAAEEQTSGGVMVVVPTVLDTMVRANTGPPPSASWTGLPITGYSNNLRIVTNQLDNASTTLMAGAYWNAGTFGPDCVATVVVPTRVVGGSFRLWARLTTPGNGTGEGVYASVTFNGAGTDAVLIGRETSVSGNLAFYNQATGYTFASGDTFALVCRGRLLEVWRLPSGGVWTRVAAAYDTIPTPVAGYIGVGITSFNAVGQHLGAFGGGVLATNGDRYPKDVISVAVPAVSIGVTSPQVTIKAPGYALNAAGFYWTNTAISKARVQMKKHMTDCYQSDDFAADDLAARWTMSHAGDWQITGGKLKPLATGMFSSLGRRLSRKDSAGVACAFEGGKVQATIKTGASVVNGVWGVQIGLNCGAFLVKTNSSGSNVFVLSNDANGTQTDPVAFTPLTGTTYKIILEALSTAVSGAYDVTAWLFDATGACLVRPLRATMGAVNAIGPTFQPCIASAPAGTDEEWDSFYAIDYTDESAYLEAAMSPGTLMIDAGRRVSQFTSAAQQASSVEASRYLASAPGTPLGWPDLCAGDGPGCLQLWAMEGAFPGNTVQVALQSRVR